MGPGHIGCVLCHRSDPQLHLKGDGGKNFRVRIAVRAHGFVFASAITTRAQSAAPKIISDPGNRTSVRARLHHIKAGPTFWCRGKLVSGNVRPVVKNKRKHYNEKTITQHGLGSCGSTEGNGTITEYTPGSVIVLKETSGPRTYHFGKTVTYVTRSGKTLDEATVRTRVKVGVPVRVHYVGTGDNLIVDRVILDED